MVLGNLIQINANGAEDKYLYGNPQVTYFKDVYKRSTNFAINYNKVPFNGGSSVEFGSEIKLNIPIKGDLLGAVFLKMSFSDLLRTAVFTEEGGDSDNTPRFTSYVNGIGYNCIDSIKLYISGQLIQTLDSKLIYLLNELYNNEAKKKSFYRMSKYTQSTSGDFIIATTNITDVESTLLLPLFFSAKPSMYLPLCALTNSEIQLHIKFKTLDKCVIRSYNTSNVPDEWSNLNTNIPATEEGYNDWVDFVNTLGGIPSINTTDTTSVLELGPRIANATTDANGNITYSYTGGITNKNDLISTIDGLYPIPKTNEKYNESVTGMISNLEIITENIFLDPTERGLFMNKELSYLIELHHIGNSEIIENPSSSSLYTMDIEGKHPTKYVLWYLQRDDVFENNMYDNHTSQNNLRFADVGNYSYSSDKHLLKDAVIMINNNELVNNINAIFLSDVQMYQKFHNSSNSIVYLYSFALDPAKTEPTGTLNFSKILHKSIRLELENESKYTNNIFSQDSFLAQAGDGVSLKQDLLFRYYTCYYNILLIRDGMCSLIYN